MSMMFEEFRTTARRHSVAEAAEILGYDEDTFLNTSTAVIVYDGMHYVEENPTCEGGHYLQIENVEHTGTREEMERVLYEWAKDEWI